MLMVSAVMRKSATSDLRTSEKAWRSEKQYHDQQGNCQSRLVSRSNVPLPAEEPAPVQVQQQILYRCNQESAEQSASGAAKSPDSCRGKNRNQDTISELRTDIALQSHQGATQRGERGRREPDPGDDVGRVDSACARQVLVVGAAAK